MVKIDHVPVTVVDKIQSVMVAFDIFLHILRFHSIPQAKDPKHMHGACHEKKIPFTKHVRVVSIPT